MLLSVTISFIIILVSAVIPIVHFIAFPISPFIAGFIGASIEISIMKRLFILAF